MSRSVADQERGRLDSKGHQVIAERDSRTRAFAEGHRCSGKTFSFLFPCSSLFRCSYKLSSHVCSSCGEEKYLEVPKNGSNGVRQLNAARILVSFRAASS